MNIRGFVLTVYFTHTIISISAAIQYTMKTGSHGGRGKSWEGRGERALVFKIWVIHGDQGRVSMHTGTRWESGEGKVDLISTADLLDIRGSAHVCATHRADQLAIGSSTSSRGEDWWGSGSIDDLEGLLRRRWNEICNLSKGLAQNTQTSYKKNVAIR